MTTNKLVKTERISAVKAQREQNRAELRAAVATLNVLRELARAERLEAAQRKQTDRLVADQAAKNDEAQPVYEGGFTGIILGGIDGDEVVAEFHVPEGIVETGVS